ncbi:MAG TPA: hypothetical protein VF627_01135 [Abditibacterium sp.]|jgi:hypothetical protein
MNKTIWKGAIALAIVWVLGVGINNLKGRYVIGSLTRVELHRGYFPTVGPSPEKQGRFDAIWHARTQRNVVGEIVPFLSDSNQVLRIEAVRALGELEDPQAQASLQAIPYETRDEKNQFRPDGVPRITLKLALGRIAARKFEGQAKVARMVREVGLSWPNLVSLSQIINGSQSSNVDTALGNEVIEEVVDLLYSMGQRGEEVEPIAQELTLAPSQRVWIQASSLNASEASKLVLNYFAHFYGSRFPNYKLVKRLVGLGPVATSAILAELQEMKRNPQKYQGVEPSPGRPGMYRSHEGYVPLFRAAAQTKDPRMIPLLKHFAQSSDFDTRRQAEIALEPRG